MSYSQKQDLVVFNDHTIISDGLIVDERHHLISIASSPSTAPYWLINSIAEELTSGKPSSLNATAGFTLNAKKKRPLIIISFSHNSHYYDNAFSKIKIPSSSYKVVDLLTDFITKSLGKPNKDIIKEILAYIPNDPSAVVLIENPEILLSLCEGLTSDELHLKLINPILRRCGVLIAATVLTSINDEIKDGVELSRFIMSLFYKSIAILSLRPLDTGRANDVTGCLRITRGGYSDDQLCCHVVENEYLYFNQKENTKLFYR